LEHPKASHDALKDRLRFLGISPQDFALLTELEPLWDELITPAVDHLYQMMESWPGLHGKFASDDRRAHARRQQLIHWKQLFSGRIDDEFMASVRRIGATHSRIGLDPRWFLGAYSHIANEVVGELLSRLVSAKGKGASLDRVRAQIALLYRLMTLDQDLVMTVYLEENDKAHAAQLRRLSEDFESTVQSALQDVTVDLGSFVAELRRSAEVTAEQVEGLRAEGQRSGASLSEMVAAIEELARSVTEIRSQTDRSMATSDQAVVLAQTTSQILGSLAAAVPRIGDAVQIIADVADRTKVLGINAAIEAARVGHAGAGFSIIAGEVRNLSNRTQGSTAVIEAAVHDVQTGSQQTQQVSDQLFGVIGNLAEAASSIAQAVDEEVVALGQMTRESQTVQETAQAVVRAMDTIADQAQASNQATASFSTLLDQRLGALRESIQAFLARIEAKSTRS